MLLNYSQWLLITSIIVMHWHRTLSVIMVKGHVLEYIPLTLSRVNPSTTTLHIHMWQALGKQTNSRRYQYWARVKNATQPKFSQKSSFCTIPLYNALCTCRWNFQHSVQAAGYLTLEVSFLRCMEKLDTDTGHKLFLHILLCACAFSHMD